MWSQVIELIKQHKHFLLTAHTNPDLDAIGSELALDYCLRQMGKECVILNSDAAPPTTRFIDPENRVRVFRSRRDGKWVARAELVFLLDVSGGWSRVGRISDTLASNGATVVRIDHHSDPVSFADVEIVDEDAAATGEMIYHLIQELGGTLSVGAAEALYAAILTDTGSFRYPKTSPDTHRIVADLLQRGVNPTRIYRQVIRTESGELDSAERSRHGVVSAESVWEGGMECSGPFHYGEIRRSRRRP